VKDIAATTMAARVELKSTATAGGPSVGRLAVTPFKLPDRH